MAHVYKQRFVEEDILMSSDAPLWIKAPLRWRHDRRLKKLSETRQRRFIWMYLLAGELDQKGAFIDSAGRKMSIEDIAIEIYCKPSDLKIDMIAFKRVGLISLNGHGPVINDFFDDQGSKTMEQRRADWRKRKKKSRTSDARDSHSGVTGPKSQSQSQSQRKNQSQRKSEEVSSVYQSSIYGREMTTDDDRTTKEQIIKFSGIQKKYSQKILDDVAITSDDLLAGLAWAYNNPKVRTPQAIAPKNILDGELPPPEWYDAERIAFNLPPRLIEKVAAHLMEYLKTENSLYDNGYPNDNEQKIIMPAPCVEDRFLVACKQLLEIEMPRSSYNEHVKDMVAINFKDDTMIIACRNGLSRDWLESRMTSTLQRSLVGAMNNGNVLVKFVEAP